MIYFIIWYLTGLVLSIVLFRIIAGEFIRKDFIISFLFAFLGPGLLLCVIFAFFIEFLDSDWGNKKLF